MQSPNHAVPPLPLDMRIEYLFPTPSEQSFHVLFFPPRPVDWLLDSG